MIRRGSIVIVSLPGDYGKPRPAVVIQSDNSDDLMTRVVCPMTSMVVGNRQHFRPIVEASEQNGLREQSQIMVDKPHVLTLEKLGKPVGTLEAPTMAEVNLALILLLGLA